MFRIDAHEADGKTTMKVVGRLGAQFAEEVRRQVLRCKDPRKLVVDLLEVTFVDNSGEEVLAWLGKIGVQFIAQGFYCLDICERLHLTIVKCNGSRRR
jgi:anti-anti-sigma regulatory factor